MYHVPSLATQEEPFDYELLDETDPFEIDRQRVHLYKHPGLGIMDAYEVWDDNPLFYRALKPPAHWLLTGEVPGGDVVTVPLCPGRTPAKCRPIGVYFAPGWLDRLYREDTR